MEKKAAVLSDGHVGRTLLKFAAPMLGGTFAMTAFHLIDTIFVARLGTLPLAAMGFSFPVIMFVGSIARGLGMGAAAVVSKAIGSGDRERARRVMTHALLLTASIVAAFSIVGLLTIGPLFRALGATEQLIPMISDYMSIWYVAMAFMMIPMMANSGMRADGDTVFPSVVMIGGCGINTILDPIMIYGWFGFPRLELAGAALATAISRAITLVLALYLLRRRHHLLELRIPKLHEMWTSWRQLLQIGIPTSATNLLLPISNAVVIRIVSQFGETAVAACAAGRRIEMFAFMIPMALGISLIPFIGQNWGAGRIDRIRTARNYANRFALLWGVGCFATLFLLSGYIATFFSEDPEVIRIITLYLRILPIGYGMRELHRYTGFTFIGVGRPMSSVAINLIRIGVFLIPLAYIGSLLYGVDGVFWGTVLADAAAAAIALLWGHRLFAGMEPAKSQLRPNEE
ncbi:MAG: MATE family efflux transporter [Candidatus Coatesbacteria bacterium]|nr:MATE family efflux transporter [Candidatus Coatesbacteria bacterium]